MTFQQLLDLIRWLTTSGGVFPLSSEMQCFSEILAELQKECLKQLDNSSQQSVLDEAVKFLAFCAKHQDLSQNIYKAIILWLAEKHQEKGKSKAEQFVFQQKIGTVFTVFLDKEESNAISFYGQEEKLRSIYTKGAALIELRKSQSASQQQPTLETLVEEISVKLKKIKKPAIILTLLKDYFDKPHQLAAFVIWLCQQNITHEAILKSGLLHAFLGFNLHILDDENNPVNVFYNLLASHENTKDLAKAAVKCRAQHEAFQNFNLQGKISKEDLKSVDIVEIELSGASLDAETFKALYELFGAEFLFQVFLWYYDEYYYDESSDEEPDEEEQIYTTLLQKVLNRDGIASSGLPLLINQLLTSYEDIKLIKRLRYLSSFISSRSLLQQLLDKDEAIAMYLLLERDDMEEFFSQNVFVGYIEKLLADNKIDLHRKFHLLYHVQVWCREEGRFILAHYLYKQLINLLLLPPYDLLTEENEAIVRQEYQFLQFPDESDEDKSSSEDESSESADESAQEELVEQAIVRFQTLDYLDKLQLQVEQELEQLYQLSLSKPDFDHADFHELQENWPIFDRKLRFIHYIRKGEKDNLNTRDTYFKETLIKKRFSLLKEQFNLKAMLAILFDLSQEKGIFECQQTLVNLLIEHDGWLARQIIEILSQNNRHWYLIQWNPEIDSLLEEAVDYSNKELVTYLLSQHSYLRLINGDIFYMAFVTAIEEGDSAIVKLFLVPEIIAKFRSIEIEAIIVTVIDTGDRTLFRLLIEHRELLTIPNSLCSSLIYKAAEIGFSEGISLLCGLRFTPEREHINKAFKTAVEAQHWDCVKVLCDVPKDRVPVEQVCLSTWRNVLATSSWEIQQNFINSTGKCFTYALARYGADYFFRNENYEGLSLLINLTGESQLKKSDLRILFHRALISPSWFMVAHCIAQLSGDRALEQADVANVILETIVPEGSSMLLRKIYESFDQRLHPDAETVRKIFQNAFQKKDSTMIAEICNKGLIHLDEEALLLSLAEVWGSTQYKDIATCLHETCKLKNLGSANVDSLFADFLQKNNCKAVEQLVHLEGEFAPQNEKIKEGVFAAVRSGNLAMASALLSTPGLRNNSDIIDSAASLAFTTNQTALFPLFDKPEYSPFVSSDNKKKMAPFVEKKHSLQLDAAGNEELSSEMPSKQSDKRPTLTASKNLMVARSERLKKAVHQGNVSLVKTIVCSMVHEKNPPDISVLTEIAKEKGHSELIDWFAKIHTLSAYRRIATVSSDKAMRNEEISSETVLHDALALLYDYTKSNRLIRFFTGHWNRHHIAEVKNILNSSPQTMSDLLNELRKIPLINLQGSLARRITYMSDFLMPLLNDEEMVSSYASNLEEKNVSHVF
ncbi:DUF5617 domain-containing protein [Legionella cardiaca]|uniref:DUF5617 domain-containing protein n=1 Tax=Legionella cardiaca TaxID=1071983 RepID=A0ABY8AN34_9GAMM|nr:DUF5617 domain-containing protein [Legionella cardiaca]WED42109.1 DUF5617 domain-containing protein [Legionella cardiaca]